MGVVWSIIIINVPLFSQPNNFISITKAIERTDYKELSTFFHPQIDLTILGKEYNCSKEQAKFIIKKFFHENPSPKFTVVHQGERERSSYVVGKYEANDKKFRIYILLKTMPDGMCIFHMRIEDENGAF